MTTEHETEKPKHGPRQWTLAQAHPLYKGASYAEARRVALDKLMNLGGAPEPNGDMVTKKNRIRIKCRPHYEFEVLLYNKLP